MATRTAKGSAKLKASGTTLTLASVSLIAGHSLIVGVGFQTTNLPTSVKWGNRTLSKVGHRLHSTPNFAAAIYHARRIRDTATRDIVATWGTSITARTLLAMTLDSPHVKDDIARNIQTGSTAPTVGPTAELERSDEFAFGVLCSEGPSSDTAPTLSGSWTAGQRVGTTGSPPASNCTLLEGYQQLTSSPAVTLSGIGATSRDWVNIVIGFRPVGFWTTDKFGSQIVVGDTVLYQGNARVVNTLRRNRNHVDLATDGWVTASEVEVLN